MKNFLFAAAVMFATGYATADDHAQNLSFEPRQDSAPMTITSINLTKGGGVISATGNMGKYGGNWGNMVEIWEYAILDPFLQVRKKYFVNQKPKSQKGFKNFFGSTISKIRERFNDNNFSNMVSFSICL